MNILDHIQKDHDEIDDIFAQMDEAGEDASKKQKLFKELKQKLRAHNHAEEVTLYKEMMEKEDTTLMAMKSDEEHHLTEKYMDDVEKSFNGSRSNAKLEVLRTLIENHIFEEEEEVFELVQNSFEENKLNEMGKQFLDEKEKKLKENKH